MKITKKITSIVLALLLAVSAVTGLAISASAADPTGTFTLDITKYDVDETATNSDLVNGTDSALTGTTADAPTDKTPLAGVKFTMVKVADWNAAVPSLTAAAALYEAAEESAKITSDATDSDGHTQITTTVAGIYYVVESESPASVTTQRTGFLVSLPMTSKADGKTQLNTVYVYPKNLTTLGGATLTKTINTEAIAADTALAVPPEFKLVDANDTAIAENIQAKAGYNVVTKATGLDAKYDTVVIAQNDGVIAVDGLPVGEYSFIETKAAQLTTDSDPLPLDSAPRTFTVTKANNVDVTTTETSFGTISKLDTDTATYALTIDNSTEPTASKTVDKTVASIAEDVTWTITPIVPADIATYKKYVVTDTIDSRLDISGADAVTVKLDGTAYTGVTPAYDETTRTVTVDFADHFADLTGKTLTIEIVTQINATAVADETIPNKATVTYRNNFQTDDQETETNEPTTKTAGFQIVKVDKADNATKLAGVEFTLKDSANNELYVTGTAGSYTICKADANGATSTVVTDADGKILVKGLKHGSYKLTETKTNSGYQLLTSDFTVTVADGTYASAVTIENVKQPDLPLTGGMGTILFTIAGLALIGGGAFFFIRSRKSKKEEA